MLVYSPIYLSTTKQIVSSTAYNWIRPSLWTTVFGGKKALLAAGGASGNAAGGAPLTGTAALQAASGVAVH